MLNKVKFFLWYIYLLFNAVAFIVTVIAGFYYPKIGPIFATIGILSYITVISGITRNKENLSLFLMLISVISLAFGAMCVIQSLTPVVIDIIVAIWSVFLLLEWFFWNPNNNEEK